MSTEDSTEDSIEKMSSSERKLRFMLARAISMHLAYYEDGEASGTEKGVTIDFMRDPVDELDRKIQVLQLKRFYAKQGKV